MDLYRYGWEIALGCYMERAKNTKIINLGHLPRKWMCWAIKKNFEFRPALGLVKLSRRA